MKIKEFKIPIYNSHIILCSGKLTNVQKHCKTKYKFNIDEYETNSVDGLCVYFGYLMKEWLDTKGWKTVTKKKKVKK